jgi:hypothetical protein
MSEEVPHIKLPENSMKEMKKVYDKLHTSVVCDICDLMEVRDEVIELDTGFDEQIIEKFNKPIIRKALKFFDDMSGECISWGCSESIGPVVEALYNYIEVMQLEGQNAIFAKISTDKAEEALRRLEFHR